MLKRVLLRAKDALRRFPDLAHLLRSISNRGGALLGLLLLLLVFSFVSPSFRQAGNLMLLVKSASIAMGIVAVGQTVVMLSGGIDLSVSSVVALTGLVSALLMKYGLGFIPPMTGGMCYVAILIGWLVGIGIGSAQGWLITKYQIPPFIVTLGTMVGLNGLSLGISNASTVSSLPDEFRWISEGRVGAIPAPVIIMFGLYIFTAYLLHNTKLGRYCYAIGGNETAARLSGVNVDRYRILFYAYSGLLAAVAGTVLISYVNGAVYTHGEGYEFSSVAAAIIGGTSLTGGVGGVWGTLIGVFILAIVPSGMVMLNAPYWWQDLVTGIVILLAVMLDMGRQRARRAAARIEVSRPLMNVRYLNELLSKLTETIEEYTGGCLCRIYMVDRETRDLVLQMVDKSEQDGNEWQYTHGRSAIVNQAQHDGQTVVLRDLTRGDQHRIMPLRPEVKSAIALPLMIRERCSGVIELHSLKEAAFTDPVISTLEELIQPLAMKLEDAWLFESGWLVRQTRDAFRHIWDDLYLGRMALIDWAFAAHELPKERTPGARGEGLRNLLLETLDAMKPLENHDALHGGRGYRILYLTYIQEQAVDQIVRMLHISRRQYFYDLKDSLEVLADLLVRNLGRNQKQSEAAVGIRPSKLKYPIRQ
jgi:inositol transport system permease protein